jgi:hypothetical protein
MQPDLSQSALANQSYKRLCSPFNAEASLKSLRLCLFLKFNASAVYLTSLTPSVTAGTLSVFWQQLLQ